MRCNDMRELLSEYYSGGLGRLRRRAVERHLAGCRDCREELDGYAALDAELAAGTGEEPPSGLWSRIESRLEERPAPRWSPRRVWAPAAAVAVTALALLAVHNPLSDTQVAEGEGPIVTYESLHARLAWDDPLADRVSLGAAFFEETDESR